MPTVGVLEARNNLSVLIKKAKAGEEVIITSRDIPQVRLVPVEPAPGHGTGAAILMWLESNMPSTPRTATQIEADIALEREAWD